jgi:hypothetical protein
LNETQKLLVYADDVDILGENIKTIKTIKTNTKAVLEAWREVGLQVNTEKTKYVVVLVTKMQDKVTI